MSLTALVVLVVYVLGLGLAFFYRPIFGLFSYLWIFYNDPSTHWWGSGLPDLRYSLIAAGVAFIAAIALTPRPVTPWLSSTGAKLMLVYVLWVWVQTGWAVDEYIHIEGAVLFTKYLVLSYVIYRVMDDEKNMELFMWAHIVGCFLFGWEGHAANTAGRLETVGGPGVDDANLLAAHLITGLVFAGFMFVGFTRAKRWAAFALIPIILNGIVLTQSRGGFLALLGAGVAAAVLAPKRYRIFVTASAVLGGVLLLVIADQAFWDRIQTITEPTTRAEEGRVKMIGPQFKMFLDHPLGAGHRGVEILSPLYMDPDALDKTVGRRAAHNTFMAALVDQGWPGALLLVSLYAWGFVTLWRLKRLEAGGASPRMMLYAAAIGTALASLLVSGLFLNLLKTEVQVWLATFLMAVSAQSTRRAVAESPAPAPILLPANASAREG